MAYNQIKRQDEEIRKLNVQITQILEKELEQKSQLFEYRRQLDDKDAQLKELNMTHKLQEAEDAHLIAELRQRVASLEVQIQELVTTGQLNHDTAMYNNLLATSTDNLMASQTNLDRHSSFKMVNRQQMMRNNSTTVPVNGHGGGIMAMSASMGIGGSGGGGGGSGVGSNGNGSSMNNSLSLSSIPTAAKHPKSIDLLGDLSEKMPINRYTHY